MQPPVALTVAASDSSGAAGLAADLATFVKCGVHATSAITAITAQTSDRILELRPVEPEMIVAQIRAAVAETPPDAVKTGLLATIETVEATLEGLHDVTAPLIVDPVLVDGSGRPIVDDDTLAAYRERLLPLAALITPNRWEAELLIADSLADPGAVEAAAPLLRSLGAGAVVVTGGRLGHDTAVDVLVMADSVHRLERARIVTTNIRGSGCVFSAATTAALASGQVMAAAVERGSAVAHAAVAASASWTGWRGRGPVAHPVAELGTGTACR